MVDFLCLTYRVGVFMKQKYIYIPSNRSAVLIGVQAEMPPAESNREVAFVFRLLSPK